MYKFFYVKKNKLIKNLYVYKKSIKYIGLKNLYYPVIIDINGKIQKTLSIWNLNIFLKSHKRKANILKFLYFVEKLCKKPINIKSIKINCSKFFKKIESLNFNMKIGFYLFLKKKSPLTKINFNFGYKINILFKKKNIMNIIIYKIIVPVIISFLKNKNINNKKICIDLYVKIKSKINIKHYIDLVENESSSQLWNFIKRLDTDYINNFSFNNPKFIEDLIRNLFYKIRKLSIDLIIKIEMLEFINNYNIYSLIKY